MNAEQETVDHGTSRGRRVGRRVLRWLGLFAVCYIVLLGAVVWFENSLLFFPDRYPGGDWQPLGLPDIEEATFEAADGIQLHGWFMPHENARAVLLFAHGNGGNLTYWSGEISRLHSLGVSVMIFDYRGYGKSAGQPTVLGILDDARAARTWLARRTEIEETDVVLMGTSLGGAVAVDLAARDGARGLVLQNTFTSLAEVGKHHFPWAPVGLLMRNRLDSAQRIGDYSGPLFASHALDDEIIPLEIGRRLFDLANEPKQFIEIADSGHNDPLPESYYRSLEEFLDRLPAHLGE